MTFVFVPWRCADEVWTRAFPDRTLGELPVAGRQFVEHQLDWADACGATDVVVLDYGYSTRLAHHLVGDGRHRWSFSLRYERLASPVSSPADVRAALDALGIGDEIGRLVVGPFFPYAGELAEIRSVREYAALNFRVLSEPRGCTLAGYSSEKGVCLGMNVILKTSREIVRPICLGDNVRVGFGCALDGRVIVGSNSIVDGGARLQDCIVLPFTYIGRKMEMRRKIVDGNRVIDIDSGNSVEIGESGLCSRIADLGFRKTIFHWIARCFGGCAEGRDTP